MLKFQNQNKVLLFALITVAFASCNTKKITDKYISHGKIDYHLTDSDELMLDSIQKQTFQYFVAEADSEKGLVRDRAQDWSPSSIAATGFSLASYGVAVERKWITRQDAVNYTLKVLRFFANSPQDTTALGVGYKGFYYHFLDMKNGKREWNCELSTIDTGLLMMGVIFARNYYDGNSPEENEIRELAAKLLGRLDWDFFYLPDSAKQPHTISMAWSPEKGILDWGWHGYDEALFLYVLAAGTGMEHAETSFEAWHKSFEWITPYPGLSHVMFPPLFGHQFYACFLDGRGLVDQYMKEKGISYFENSRRATLVQQQYNIQNPKGWIGYDSLTWGITASDGPGSKYDRDTLKFNGYAGRGTSGVEHTIAEDGTIAPYGSLSSIAFTPELSLATIRNMTSKYGNKIWGRFGYYDSFNLTAGWYDNDYIGIDEGPMLLMIENFRTGLIWDNVMKDPVIQKGLERLHFEYIKETPNP